MLMNMRRWERLRRNLFFSFFFSLNNLIHLPRSRMKKNVVNISEFIYVQEFLIYLSIDKCIIGDGVVVVLVR